MELVDAASKDEEAVAESIQVDNCFGPHLLQVEESSFGATRNSAAVMERRRRRTSCRENESLESGEVLFMLVDQTLQRLDCFAVDEIHLQAVDLFRNACDFRAKDKEFILNEFEFTSDFVGQIGSTGNSEDRIEFIDCSVGVDSICILHDSGSTKESCLALVAGARVDLHRAQASTTQRSGLGLTSSWLEYSNLPSTRQTAPEFQRYSGVHPPQGSVAEDAVDPRGDRFCGLVESQSHLFYEQIARLIEEPAFAEGEIFVEL